MAPFYIFLWGRLARFFKYLSTFADRPVPFEPVWILAALVQLKSQRSSLLSSKLWGFTYLPQARNFKCLGYSILLKDGAIPAFIFLFFFVCSQQRFSQGMNLQVFTRNFFG